MVLFWRLVICRGSSQFPKAASITPIAMMSVKACTMIQVLTRMVELFIRGQSKGKIMPKQSGSAESIYKIVEVIGTSTKSWDDAAKNAVETAAGTLRDLRIAEIVKLDMKVEDGKVRAYRARVMLSFKYES
jgi:flavin-binding protein dodecin